MPGVIDLEDERNRARRERRAKLARKRYHANLDAARTRCKVAKQRQRSTDAADFPTGPGAKKYDADDYASEWLFLTYGGLRAEEIIRKSRPAREWFTDNVLPLVNRAICSYCGGIFNPQMSGMLTRCAQDCGFTRAGGTGEFVGGTRYRQTN